MNELMEAPTAQIVQQAQPAMGQVATYTPSDLLMVAIQQNADLDKLDRLMQLQDRYEAKNAEKAFVDAMANFKLNAPKIYKDKAVSFNGTSYTHASLGNICDEVIAKLAQHGISHEWDTQQPDNGMIVVTCILTHKLGHSKQTTLQAPPDNSGKKNGIQQIASTVSYLQRYTLLGACGLSTMDSREDDDGHNASLSNGDEESETLTRILAGIYTHKDEASLMNYWKTTNGLLKNPVEHKKFKDALSIRRAELIDSAAKVAATKVPDELKELVNELEQAAKNGIEFLDNTYKSLSKATQEKLAPFYNEFKTTYSQNQKVAA